MGTETAWTYGNGRRAGLAGKGRWVRTTGEGKEGADELVLLKGKWRRTNLPGRSAEQRARGRTTQGGYTTLKWWGRGR
eukprot:scaffold64686_cov32-Tisochrysis_lutea.AAC.1